MGVGVRATIGLAALCVAGSVSPSQAQDIEPWPPAGVSFYGDHGVPDFSGLWLGSETEVPGEEPAPNRGPADGSPPSFWSPSPLPWTPAYKKIVDERAAAAKEGKALGDTTARCLPFGLPQGLTAKVYPDEIVQTPGEVTIFRNSSLPIVIWTDGRGHPKDWKPSFNGHSTGYWVGDTLFVDTIGITHLTTIDHQLNPHSDKIHLRWSIRRVAPDRLHFNIEMRDADAFTEPVGMVNIWRRMNDARWQVLDDGSCFENNRTKVDDQGNTDGFVKF